MYQVFLTFIAELILIKDFSFPWIHGITHDHILWASNYTNEWRTTPRIIPKFDNDPTPLWWRFQTTKNAPLSWSWTFLSLVLLHFFQTLVPWWFCCRLTPLLVVNLKLFTKVFTKLKTLPSLHGFQFPTLDTIIGYVVQFIDYLLITRRIT